MKTPKTVTLKEAMRILDEAHEITPGCGRDHAYAIGTLYNYIHRKVLTRHGPKHIAKVDVEQLLRVLGPKKVS